LLCYDVLLYQESESCDIANFRNKLTAFPSSSPTFYPVTSVYHFEVDSRDLLFKQLHLLSQTFFFAPIYSTISLYIYTNLHTIKGAKIALPLVTNYLTIAGLNFLLAREPTDVHLGALLIRYSTAGTVMLTVMVLLVKMFGLKWHINVRWVPALFFCNICVCIICRMPRVSSLETLEQIVVYIPLLFTFIEWAFLEVLCRLLNGYENNDMASTFSMAFMTLPMEFSRFISFVVIWKKHRDGAPPHRAIFYFLSTLAGDIYSHTQVYLLIKNEIDMRLYGRRRESSKHRYYFSSIRTYLEFVAPAVFAIYVSFAYIFDCHMRIMGSSPNFTYQANITEIANLRIIVFVYYFLELMEECICHLIRMHSEFQHLSAIGNLKCRALFMMIVYVGIQHTIISTTTMFFRVMM